MDDLTFSFRNARSHGSRDRNSSIPPAYRWAANLGRGWEMDVGVSTARHHYSEPCGYHLSHHRWVAEE